MNGQQPAACSRIDLTLKRGAQAHWQSRRSPLRVPKQLLMLQLLSLQFSIAGAMQNGGSGVQATGRQHSGPAQGLN
jgi:hypothetical protein